MKRATPRHRLELGKLQSREAEARAYPARSINPSSRASHESPDYSSSPSSPLALEQLLETQPRPLGGSHPLRHTHTACPWSARAPQLQGLSTAPSVGQLDPDTGPQPNAGAPSRPHLPTPTHQPLRSEEPRPLSLGPAGSSPGGAVGPRPASSALAHSSLLPSPGAPITPPPPPACPSQGSPVPGSPGRPVPPPPSPARGKETLGPLGGRGRRGVGRSLRPGTPHLAGFGVESPAPLPLASEPPVRRGGGRPDCRGPGRLTPAGQWRSPLSALHSSRRPRIGRSPPTPIPGGGAERTAARVSRPGHGPEATPARGSPPPPSDRKSVV